jgi:DNA-directed RNA polymerase subunit RPC12/RpoP
MRSADPYRCASCDAPVTPAPASVEHDWSTVCRTCSEAGR